LILIYSLKLKSAFDTGSLLLSLLLCSLWLNGTSCSKVSEELNRKCRPKTRG